jgi:multidrug efflux pump subunit AcrA (membrane-fusion protein)
VIQRGRWVTSEALKALKPGGRLPPHTVFATVIPEQAPLALHSFIAEDRLNGIVPDAKGWASLAGAPHARFPVRVVSVSAAPEPDGRYHLVLEADFPGKIAPVCGMTAKVVITAYHMDKALVIPRECLREKPDGSAYVVVKGSEGRTEERSVRLGRFKDDEVELLFGVKRGETIVAEDSGPEPDEKKSGDRPGEKDA